MRPPAGTTARDTRDPVIRTCAPPPPGAGQKRKDARTGSSAPPRARDPVDGQSSTRGRPREIPPVPLPTGGAGRPRDGVGESWPSDEERERRGGGSMRTCTCGKGMRLPRKLLVGEVGGEGSLCFCWCERFPLLIFGDNM
ncbi:hypothetical protein NL676_010342 [Syzygium grande]|nr:hypothetical protein NL676_010342 [Syzygium grande]